MPSPGTGTFYLPLTNRQAEKPARRRIASIGAGLWSAVRGALSIPLDLGAACNFQKIVIYEYLNMNQALSDLQVFKAEFFRALAHPVRIRILEELGSGSRTVHALQEALGLDQPTVSQQLAVLRAKNLVVTTKSGSSVHYATRDPLIHELLMTARVIFNNHLVDTQAMLTALTQERERAS